MRRRDVPRIPDQYPGLNGILQGLVRDTQRATNTGEMGSTTIFFFVSDSSSSKPWLQVAVAVYNAQGMIGLDCHRQEKLACYIHPGHFRPASRCSGKMVLQSGNSSLPSRMNAPAPVVLWWIGGEYTCASLKSRQRQDRPTHTVPTLSPNVCWFARSPGHLRLWTPAVSR